MGVAVGGKDAACGAAIADGAGNFLNAAVVVLAGFGFVADKNFRNAATIHDA